MEAAEKSTRVDTTDPAVPPGDDGQLPEDMGPITWEGAELLREHLVPIRELRQHPGNSRIGDVPAIADSLRRFGQMRPVLSDPSGMIVAGHHVVKAARLLEWTHVAVIPATFLSDEERAAYLIADNQLSEIGSVDPRKQMGLVESLTNLEGTGYSEEDRERLKLEALVIGQIEENARVEDLTAHERDPRDLTPEQLQHLTAGLRTTGFYRKVIIARDGTILAGRELVEAASEVGLKKVPVTRYEIEPDSPEALKVIAADTEVQKIGKLDDRKMAELLKEVRDTGDVEALVGTGHNAETLAAMVMVTRPKTEVEDVDAAKEWVGLPEFTPSPHLHQVVISCDTEEDRDALIEELSLIIHYKRERSWSAPYPPRKRDELKHLRFEG